MTKQWWARVVVGRTAVSDPFQQDEPPDAQFEAEWRPNVKARLLILLGLIAVWTVAVEAQLVYLQVYSHDRFLETAKRQQREKFAPEAPRGDITDRNGQLLAYAVPSVEVFADPGALYEKADKAQKAKNSRENNPDTVVVRDPKPAADLARELCAVLGDCTADEQAIFAAKLMRFARGVPLRSPKAMTATAMQNLHAWLAWREQPKLKLPRAIFVENRDVRYYPKMKLASHTLGFVGADGKGAGGVEQRFDTELRGKPGLAYSHIDGRTNEMFTRVEREPVPGPAVELTIDINIQNIAEQALRDGIRASGAAGGTAIVMRSETGEILALANWPDYNPNIYWTASDDLRNNRAIQQIYEPGSTAKVLTLMAALNEGVVKPTDLIDTGPGVLKLPGRTIKEAQGHNYGVLTAAEVLIRSSNVGAAKIGWRVGKDRMLQYLSGVGIGQRLAPDFIGEAMGFVGDAKNLNDSGLASVSIGYQVAVNPLQLVTAMNVIASGGLLMEPRLVRAFVRDGRREVEHPKVLRRVVTPETADTMAAILEGVVSEEIGTGHAAALERYHVAGKTGTAAKIVDRRYSKSEYNVSFLAFVPSRRPVYTILVVVDTPTNGSRYGGTVAGPIFKRIAEAALQYAGIPPSINPTPPIVVPAVPVDRSVLPERPTRASAILPMPTTDNGRLVMPDLRGKTLRDALRMAYAVGLDMTPDGDGVVVFQTPQPGTVIDAPGRGVLHLRRTPAKAGGAGGGDR